MIIDHTKTCKSKDYILASDEKFYTALISMKLFYGCITRSHHKKTVCIVVQDLITMKLL